MVVKGGDYEPKYLGGNRKEPKFRYRSIFCFCFCLLLLVNLFVLRLREKPTAFGSQLYFHNPTSSRPYYTDEQN